MLEVPITICAAVGTVACGLELHGRQPRTVELSRRQLAGLAFLLGLLALVVISPQIALVFDRPLPVEPPADPLAGQGCSSDNSDHTILLVIVLVMYFGARAGLGILGAVVRALAPPPSRVVTGKPSMTVAAFFLAAIFPIVTARLLLPGPSPDDFATYGALTPDAGARGWRADLVIDGMCAGPLADLPRFDTAVSDIKLASGGHGTFSTGPYLAPGVHAWVADEPALIFKEGERLVGAPVYDRNPERVPLERRPRFQSWPQVAPRADGEGWILVERRPDGRRFAMKVASYGDAEDAEFRDVWALVRPSEIPHGIAFALVLLGIACARASQRRGNTPGFALCAAWLWLEAGALDLYAYAPVLGL